MINAKYEENPYIKIIQYLTITVTTIPLNSLYCHFFQLKKTA